jgi:hypothetical protein
MNANEILLWMSAKQMGSWASYKDALEEITEPDEENGGELSDSELSLYQRLRLNLERLAHVEFRGQDFPNGWRVVPPTIAIKSGERVGILCGARTDPLISCIRNAAGVRVTPQSECPDRIEILPGCPFDRIAADNGMLIQHDATETLLAAHPPVDEWQLRSPRELPFGNDAPVSSFCPSTLDWTASSPDEARKTPFGLFRWQVMYDRHYYLKRRTKTYRLPVQVGKYLVLSHARRRVLAYEPTTQMLTMPVVCRPPMLIDRALTLRTGLIPEVRQGILTYQNITNAIAMTTAAILRQ